MIMYLNFVNQQNLLEGNTSLRMVLQIYFQAFIDARAI